MASNVKCIVGNTNKKTTLILTDGHFHSSHLVFMSNEKKISFFEKKIQSDYSKCAALPVVEINFNEKKRKKTTDVNLLVFIYKFQKKMPVKQLVMKNICEEWKSDKETICVNGKKVIFL